MSGMRKLLWLVVLSTVLVPVHAAPQTPQATLLSQTQGLQLMRIALSAEVQIASRSQGRFGSFADIAGQNSELAAFTRVNAIDSTLGRYRLRLIVTDDGRHFQVTLTPESGCLISWFSDDRNIIYVGSPLGC